MRLSGYTVMRLGLTQPGVQRGVPLCLGRRPRRGGVPHNALADGWEGLPLPRKPDLAKARWMPYPAMGYSFRTFVFTSLWIVSTGR